MKWKVGDIAIYDCPDSPSGIHGMVVTITGPLESHFMGDGVYILGHAFDPGVPPPRGWGWANSPEHFKPLPPPNEVTSWDECVFKPKVLERIE